LLYIRVSTCVLDDVRGNQERLTNDDRRDLSHFAYILVGLDDSLYPCDGELRLYYDAFDLAWCWAMLDFLLLDVLWDWSIRVVLGEPRRILLLRLWVRLSMSIVLAKKRL